jgi:hypothetical protein
VTLAPDEADLIEAQRLRDLARDILRSDLDTLREDLARRPLAGRARDAVVTAVADTAESGIDLARENIGVLALTGATLLGWLFRKPLGALAQSGLARAGQWLAQRR